MVLVSKTRKDIHTLTPLVLVPAESLIRWGFFCRVWFVTGLMLSYSWLVGIV